MKIALIAPNGKYVAAELDGTVFANRDSRGPWETWTVEKVEGNAVHFKSAHGRYLVAELGGGGDVNANRPVAGPWETFRLDLTGMGPTSIQTVSNDFLRAGLGDRVDARSMLQNFFTVKIVEADPVVSGPQRLHTQDKYFYTNDGQRHTMIGSTELLLAHKYDTQGPESIDPILEERAAIGFNNLRVLWQKDIRNAGQPWLMPLDKIPPFLERCGAKGFHVQGCILADGQVVNPDTLLQGLRVSEVRYVTQPLTHILIEQLGNEAFKNGFDPLHFSQPADRLATRASGINFGSDEFHAQDVWDFFTFSGDRSPEQKAIREYGPMEAAYAINKPAVCDEGMVPGENSSDPRDFERAGSQARSASRAGRFHSRAGSNRDSGDENLARLFTPLEKDCAIAFVQGMIG